jgi:4-amino-4-deoxy-L-arabinose transferase-like glycosyltransferase
VNLVRRYWLFVVILAVALTLRLWGIEFGLPNTRVRPDEGRVVGEAARFTMNRTLDPDYFTYPSFFLYVIGTLYAAGCETQVIAHIYPSVRDCAAAWPQNWTPLFITARTVSAVAGVAGVAAVFFIGRRLHALGGWLASAFLAVAFLHVRDSHFAVTDVTMTSILLWALLLLLRADERPSPGSFLLAGFITGIAMSTKYNAVMLGLAAIISQVRAWVRPEATQEQARHTRLVLFGTMTVVGFLAASPYAVLNRIAFIRDTSHEYWHLLYGARVPLGIGWRYHALLTLPQGVGWPLFVLGVAGILWMLAVRTRSAAIVFAFPILYYVVAGRGHSVYVRYMIPIVPFLCLGAAAFVATLRDRVTRSAPVLARATLAGLVLVWAGPVALKSAQFFFFIAHKD